MKTERFMSYKILTDDTLRETMNHGDSRYPFAYYPENIWQFDFHRIDWHWHYELELLYGARGSVVCLAGTKRIELREGQGIFINSGVLHRYEVSEDTFSPNIVFSPTLLAAENTLIYSKYIRPVINSGIPYQVLDPYISWQKEILEILEQVFEIQETEEKNELRTLQRLFEIWELFTLHLDLRSDSLKKRGMNHKQAKLQTMMQYIHDHYREEITLEMIAGSAAVSKSSALHIFQSGIRTSPVAYLISYRLSQAAEQLYTTQKSVSAIAEETGFASTGYFCRKFRQHYHMSANEYRKTKLSLPHV